MSDNDKKIGKHYTVNFFELESITVECPFSHRWDLEHIHEMITWADQSCPECETMARWIVSVNKYGEENDSSDSEQEEQEDDRRGPGTLPDDYFKRTLG